MVRGRPAAKPMITAVAASAVRSASRQFANRGRTVPPKVKATRAARRRPASANRWLASVDVEPGPAPHPPADAGPSLSPLAAGLSGENSAAEQQGNRPNDFVLAGLGPAIQCAEHARQLGGVSPLSSLMERRISEAQER